MGCQEAEGSPECVGKCNAGIRGCSGLIRQYIVSENFSPKIGRTQKVVGKTSDVVFSTFSAILSLTVRSVLPKKFRIAGNGIGGL